VTSEIKLYGIKTKTGKIKQSVSSLMRSIPNLEDGEECVEVELVEKGAVDDARERGYKDGWDEGEQYGYDAGRREFEGDEFKD